MFIVPALEHAGEACCTVFKGGNTTHNVVLCACHSGFLMGTLSLILRSSLHSLRVEGRGIATFSGNIRDISSGCISVLKARSAAGPVKAS